VSGATSERPGLGEAISHLREGDCRVVWNLDRPGRSLKDLIVKVEALGDALPVRRARWVPAEISEGAEAKVPSTRRDAFEGNTNFLWGIDLFSLYRRWSRNYKPATRPNQADLV